MGFSSRVHSRRMFVNTSPTNASRGQKVYCRAGGRLPSMKLSERTLEELAKMVVGDAKHFPYRSSYHITRFFARCGLPFEHDGSTRPIWARERLAELNLGQGSSPDLPSDD